MQVFSKYSSVIHLISKLRIFYTVESIYIVSDNFEKGHLNLTSDCVKYKCHWRTDFLVGGHGQNYKNILGGLIYLQRVLKSIQLCKCKFLINLEEDTCVLRRVRYNPKGDVGGFPWPHFSPSFIDLVRKHNFQTKGQFVWGCATGCYYRSSFFLEHQQKMNHTLLYRLRNYAPLQYADVIGPIFTLYLGGEVIPWNELYETQYRKEISESSAAFVHSKQCL